VSANQKLLAALLGLVAIVLLYLVVAVMNGSANPLKVIAGTDGPASTSKFQWALWLIVILFAYVFLWFIRTRRGDWNAISTVPSNLLTVLGFSTLTAVGAKGIVVGYTGAGSLAKGDATNAATKTRSLKGGLLTDDSGTPELSKIQLVAFTFVAVGIFLYDVYHQAKGSHPTAQLPNIDSSLLVLMGISQGGYLGKKLVTTTTPLLNILNPKPAWAGAPMSLKGASFGQGAGGSRLLLDGAAIPTENWTDSEIAFRIPTYYPKVGEEDWPDKKLVSFGIDLGGGIRGNEVTVVVLKTQPEQQPQPSTPPAPATPPPAPSTPPPAPATPPPAPSTPPPAPATPPPAPSTPPPAPATPPPAPSTPPPAPATPPPAPATSAPATPPPAPATQSRRRGRRTGTS
jgi:hypothetical protein